MDVTNLQILVDIVDFVVIYTVDFVVIYTIHYTLL